MTCSRFEYLQTFKWVFCLYLLAPHSAVKVYMVNNDLDLFHWKTMCMNMLWRLSSTGRTRIIILSALSLRMYYCLVTLYTLVGSTRQKRGLPLNVSRWMHKAHQMYVFLHRMSCF